MTSLPTTRTPLRRTLLACAAGVTALGVLPAASSAQTSQDPSPQGIDALCAEVPTADDFVDVGDQAWSDAVRCLAYAGITGGITPDRYGPGRAVTRQQMGSFVARMMDVAEMRDPGDEVAPLPPYDHNTRLPFTDVDGTHNFAIARLAAAGIADGGPGGLPPNRFGPDRTVTRAQMASFITRAIEHLTGVERQPVDDHFTDDETNVHEANVNVLADAGIVVGYGDGTYRPDAPVQRSSMASYLVRSLAHLEEAGTVDALPARPEAPAVPLAVATPGGVVVTDADGSTRRVVSTGSAAVAYAVGPELVVYQDASDDSSIDWDATGPVRVWTPEGVEALPIAADMSGTYLLDARLVDGVPTALVSEAGGGFEDARNELFLVDLVDGTRTTIDRADDGAAWEAGYASGRILPDGDVVVVEVSEAHFWIEAWTPGDDEPRWTSQFVQAGGGGEVVEHDGAIYAIEPFMGTTPTAIVTRFDPATGAQAESRSVTIPDFAGRGFSWFECTDLLTEDVLACGRDGRTPIGIDLRTGWFRTLPGGVSALPTEVREGTAG